MNELESNEYEILDISEFDWEDFEQLGTKPKFWYVDQNIEYLFKSTKARNSERLGEDWAEKIACELAEILGLPHAHYELAVHNGVRGVVTKNFVNKNFLNRSESLTPGNELLQEYIVKLEDKNPNIQYVEYVHKVMEQKIVGKPLGFPSFLNIKTASEFFVGYLMFDALISNQDRHNENWGMITTSKGDKHLAPSYDHGASLARNESDETRKIRLESKDKGQQVSIYVKKAKSQFQHIESNKRLKLLEAFRLYGLMEKKAALAWLDRLKELNERDMWNIINKVPSNLMSDIAKMFTYQLLICNRSNLLEMYVELSEGA
jgi:hypothetical protein